MCMGLLYNGAVVMHGVQRVSLIISLKARYRHSN